MKTLLGWSAPVDTVMAVRRVFAKSWTGASLKALALACICVAESAATVAGVILYALLQL